MNVAQLSKVKAFCAGLMRLADSGLPITVGGEQQTPESLRELLKEYELACHARLGAESSLPGATGSTTTETGAIVDSLDAAFRAWQCSEGSPAAYEEFATQAFAIQQKDAWRRVRWLQPVIWIVVSTASFMFIVFFLIPRVARLSRQISSPAGPLLSSLLSIREVFAGWLVFLPIILLAVLWGLFSWRRVRSRAGNSMRNLASNKAKEQSSFSGNALHLSGVAKRSAIIGVTHGFGTEPVSPSLLSEDVASRPLMQWALASERPESTGSSTTEERFGLAAKCYESLAHLDALERDPTGLPWPIVTIAGLIVLAICSCVFLPLVNLLLQVAQ